MNLQEIEQNVANLDPTGGFEFIYDLLRAYGVPKASISRLKHAVMVEGYFDWAQAYQAGITNVVASSGTALTPAQVRLLKRFAAKAVLSFDPDAAGQGAAARSSELLVSEGFQVNVAMLPAGDDPDNFIRKHGGAAYQAQLRASRPYLEYLLERTAAEHDFNKDDSRREFLGKMLTIAARIPDAAARDQFADRLAHKARITEEVVRAEIRKAAVQRQTTVDERKVPAVTQLKAAEKGLIWALLHQPADGLEALSALDEEDLAGLASEKILEQARSLQGSPPEALPSTLIERLTRGEAQLVTELGRPASPPAPSSECVLALKRRRFDRERAEVQREIVLGGARHDPGQERRESTVGDRTGGRDALQLRRLLRGPVLLQPALDRDELHVRCRGLQPAPYRVRQERRLDADPARAHRPGQLRPAPREIPGPVDDPCPGRLAPGLDRVARVGEQHDLAPAHEEVAGRPRHLLLALAEREPGQIAHVLAAQPEVRVDPGRLEPGPEPAQASRPGSCIGLGPAPVVGRRRRRREVGRRGMAGSGSVARRHR